MKQDSFLYPLKLILGFLAVVVLALLLSALRLARPRRISESEIRRRRRRVRAADEGGLREMTLDATIRAVQAKLGVTVDGNPGPQTWNAIYRSIVGEPPVSSGPGNACR